MRVAVGLGMRPPGSVRQNDGPPTVASVTPASIFEQGGQYVVVRGTSLNGATIDIGVTGATVVSSSYDAVTILTPIKAAGVYGVKATTGLGDDTLAGSLTVTDVPACAVTDCDPKYTAISGGDTVTLDGTFVRPGLRCAVGGSDFATGVLASITYVDPSTATIVIPPGLTGGYGPRTIWVEMYGAGNAANLPDVLHLAPVATITSVDVTQRPLAGTGTITVTGTNFRSALAGGNTGTLGGTPVTITYVSATEVTFVAPSHTAGAKDLVITNVGGTSAPLVGAVTYYAAPTIIASTNTPKTYAQATRLTVSNSTGITGGTLGGTALTGVSVFSPTQVDVTFPGKTAGAHDLILTGHPGGSSSAYSITTVNTAPVAGTNLPTSGGEGDTVTHTGSRFGNGNATSATLGGIAVDNFTVVDENTITFDVPTGLSDGFVDLIITGPAGSSSAVSFEYADVAFSPLDLGAKLIQFLDGTDGATASLWLDHSANEIDQEQTVGGKQPTIAASDFDGNTAVVFSAASTQTMVSSVDATFGPCRIFDVVFCQAGARLGVHGVATGEVYYHATYMSGAVQGLIGDGTKIDLLAVPDLYDPTSGVRVIEQVWGGTLGTHKYFENGVELSSSTYFENGVGSSTPTGKIHIASWFGTSEYNSQKHYMRIITTYDLTSEELTNVYQFIQNRFPSVSVTVP
jgi:hypothetical protein